MIGSVAVVTRYPVKSLVGEDLPSARVDARGVEGDRLWAVRDADGKLGSGKDTRRFRRMDGLLQLRAQYAPDLIPTVVWPDGTSLDGATRASTPRSASTSAARSRSPARTGCPTTTRGRCTW